MSNQPPKTIIITGISPHSPLSTHIATRLLTHFTKTSPSTNGSSSSSTITQTLAISLALLGPSLPHLESTASHLATLFPDNPNLQIHPYEVTITSAQSIGKTAHSIRATMGAAHILIHNAPAFLPFPTRSNGLCVPIRGADEDDWWEIFEVNVRSIQFVTRHFFTKMREGAVFVNVLPWRDVGVVGDGEGGGTGMSAWEGSGVAAEQVMGHLMGENKGFRCHCVYVRQGFEGEGQISGEEWEDSVKKVVVGLNCW